MFYRKNGQLYNNDLCARVRGPAKWPNITKGASTDTAESYDENEMASWPNTTVRGRVRGRVRVGVRVRHWSFF